MVEDNCMDLDVEDAVHFPELVCNDSCQESLQFPSYSKAKINVQHTQTVKPPPVAATAVRMLKQDVVSAHASRFNKSCKEVQHET